MAEARIAKIDSEDVRRSIFSLANVTKWIVEAAWDILVYEVDGIECMSPRQQAALICRFLKYAAGITGIVGGVIEFGVRKTLSSPVTLIAVETAIKNIGLDATRGATRKLRKYSERYSELLMREIRLIANDTKRSRPERAQEIFTVLSANKTKIENLTPELRKSFKAVEARLKRGKLGPKAPTIFNPYAMFAAVGMEIGMVSRYDKSINPELAAQLTLAETLLTDTLAAFNPDKPVAHTKEDALEIEWSVYREFNKNLTDAALENISHLQREIPRVYPEEAVSIAYIYDFDGEKARIADAGSMSKSEYSEKYKTKPLSNSSDYAEYVITDPFLERLPFILINVSFLSGADLRQYLGSQGNGSGTERVNRIEAKMRETIQEGEADEAATQEATATPSGPLESTPTEKRSEEKPALDNSKMTLPSMF
jgi:hypothetical protein